ncbi:hypothetical protein LCGC14_1827490 [marine sediment metagenome]|uniref:Thymidylate synthase/dCMP hydroxymethylase domain-containing protein n=1 Tax=marine sediment metagenome TaxID=412755 RepID=A0A0F9JGL4_9ZZZZ
MRIYTDPLQAVREVERDLWEMGIDVHPQTMQDKDVADDDDFRTKEVQGYGFKINGWAWNHMGEADVIKYLFSDTNERARVLAYIGQEFEDRMAGEPINPGNAWMCRPNVWEQFMHNGKFAYTYSERMAPQLQAIIDELKERPDSRQGIINIHSNICPDEDGNGLHGEISEDSDTNIVWPSADMENKGGSGRIPCSMYYQIMRRAGKTDLIYTMRSCDFLTHFPIDLMLALRLQLRMALEFGEEPGTFTYFMGSLHAYAKDMKDRGIF